MEGFIYEISDHPTLPLKRKAECFKFYPEFRSDEFYIHLIIQHFNKNEDGTYGDKFAGKAVIDFDTKLVANNVRKIDPTDGMELYSYVAQEKTEETEEVIGWKRMDNNAIITNYMGQFDYVDYIMRHVPVIIAPTIGKFVHFDDLMKHKFD